MPQVIALALFGAGLYAGYRWFARAVGGLGPTIARAKDERQQSRQQSHAQSRGRIEKDLGALEWDPVVGVYRPAKRN
ncbi:MAG TPA: hypothetical protein VLL28_04890 [Hyphomicrobiaceae bacterium]|nr:hypothetical protein [Hyphomicrobiaceae bacterium]